MKTTIKCNKDFTFNDRNAVEISNDSKLDVNDNLRVEDYEGNLLYDIKISDFKSKVNSRKVDFNNINNGFATVFIGEPVLDLMVDVKSGVCEYVPGGQALSQAIAFKNANPDKKVIFVGNFGSDFNGNLDECGNVICDFLEDIGISVVKALAPGKKTRNNFVFVDDNGRTILNPVKDSDKPEIDKDNAYKVVSDLLSSNPNISYVGVDGSLETIINNVIGILIGTNYSSLVEVDAGRKTMEEILEMRDLHSLFEYYGSYQSDNSKLHIITSKSYANTLIKDVPIIGDMQVIEPDDGVVSKDIIKNNCVILQFIQDHFYPYANIGVTTGGCGCYYIDDDGIPNYLPSYTPNDTNGEKFKDNSAGDTFHALFLSALQEGYSTTYAYQYATIGTSIAGYGHESTAKMNTPKDEEIKKILEEENPFYDYVNEDGVIVWSIGEKRNIKDKKDIKRYYK